MAILGATIKQKVSIFVTFLIGLATSFLEIVVYVCSCLSSSVEVGSSMRSGIQANMSLMALDILYGLSSNKALFMLIEFPGFGS